MKYKKLFNASFAALAASVALPGFHAEAVADRKSVV